MKRGQGRNSSKCICLEVDVCRLLYHGNVGVANQKIQDLESNHFESIRRSDQLQTSSTYVEQIFFNQNQLKPHFCSLLDIRVVGPTEAAKF